MNTETETILDGGSRLAGVGGLAVGVQELAPDHQVNDHTATAAVLSDGNDIPLDGGGIPTVHPGVAPSGLPTRLRPDEETELALCKEIIDRGLDTFLEVGMALTTVRDKRLYRGSYDTFEDWCRAEYGWTSHRARQLIRGAEVVRNLQLPVNGNNCSAFVLPASESQARPLLRLPPEEQRAAWAEVVRTAPNGRLTAAHVEKVVSDWRVKLGLQEASPGPVATAAAAGPILDVQPVPNKQRQLREAADRAIKAVREILNLQGTPDSRETGLTPIVDMLQDYKDHLTNVERMQVARPKGSRVGTTGRI